VSAATLVEVFILLFLTICSKINYAAAFLYTAWGGGWPNDNGNSTHEIR
jgi:hypothetical protein